MQTLPNHFYSNNKNKTLLWVDSDSEEVFNKHMQDPARRKQLEKYGWDRPEVITYRFNSHGFRCNEFDDSKGIITIGCSFTAGVGLPLESIWPTIVGQQLGVSVWNLSIGGGSMDTCFRLLHHYIDKLRAEYVLLLAPPLQRFELHTEEKVLCFHPGTATHPVQKWWYACESNSELNFLKNMLALEQLCFQHKKRLIVKRIETDLFGIDTGDKWPPARDMLHVGEIAQAYCATKFLETIKTDQANL